MVKCAAAMIACLVGSHKVCCKFAIAEATYGTKASRTFSLQLQIFVAAKKKKKGGGEKDRGRQFYQSRIDFAAKKGFSSLQLEKLP